MHIRASLLAFPLLLLSTGAVAAPGITELPDRIIVELRGTPPAPAPPSPLAPPREPYLVERIVEHADHYEVELIGRPDRGKLNAADQPVPSQHHSSASAMPATSEPPSLATPRATGASAPLAASSYYKELSERIRTLQRERQECLKMTPGEDRGERERKRREADEKFREIRDISARMAQLREQEGS